MLQCCHLVALFYVIRSLLKFFYDCLRSYLSDNSFLYYTLDVQVFIGLSAYLTKHRA